MSIFGQTATTKPAQPTADLTYYIFIGVILFILILLSVLSAWLYIDSYDIKTALNTIIDNIPFLNLLHINLNDHYYVFSNKLELILNVSSVVSATITTVIISQLYFNESNSLSSEIYITGRKLLSNNDAIKMFIKKMNEEKKWGLRGLALIQTTDNQKLEISEDRETRHILIAGSIGGGKTTVMRNYIDEAINRKDKCLILDNKSDFTKTLRNEFILIAPWDSRGAAWDVASDIQTRHDAKSFAAATIEVSEKDPLWGNAARAILEAMIIRAQKENSKNWDFGFITDIMIAGDSEIQQTVKRYTPEYSALVADMQSKTTQSIMINLIAFMKPIFNLADAYSRCKTQEKFSFRSWLLDEENRQTVVIQGNGAHSELQRALTQAIFAYITRVITSPEITDVRANKRRIQIFCDEFVQFGKIEDFGTLIEIGRSKGVRIVLGVQDISQLRKIYGQETTQTWLSSLGTYIICRINGQETAEYFSKIFGNKRVKTYQPSVSLQQSAAGGNQRTDQWIEQELPVFRTDEFSRLLNVNEKGVQVAVFTSDDFVYLIRAKHLSESQKHERRAATKAARWTQVGWPSSEDLIIANEKQKNKENFDETLDEITS